MFLVFLFYPTFGLLLKASLFDLLPLATRGVFFTLPVGFIIKTGGYFMIIQQCLLPDDHQTNTGLFFSNYRHDSITIHWTGELFHQSPSVVKKYWEREGNSASAHFIIKDEACLQCLPVHRVAYHCGNPTGNATSLGIEVIPQSELGEFSARSIETLRNLLFLFHPTPILRHYDWSGKDCPRFYLDEERWKQLLLAITPSSW